MDFETIEYPEVVTDVKEIKAVHDTTDTAMDKVGTEVDSLYGNLNVLTSDAVGISRREKILGISPLDTDTLAERIYKVWTLWYDTVPYTLYDLKQRLPRLCPDDGYTLTINYNDPSIDFKLGLTNKKNYAAVCALLEQLVPEHVFITTSLLYNTWSLFASKTWGSLESTTWQSMMEDIIS